MFALAHKSDRISRRKGAASLELAVFLPMIFLITMGTIETCRVVYLRQSIKIAAYECARLAIIRGTTSEVLQDQCAVILLARNIEGFKLSCEPADPATLKPEQLFTATVTVPASEAALVGSWYYDGKILTESVSIMGEN